MSSVSSQQPTGANTSTTATTTTTTIIILMYIINNGNCQSDALDVSLNIYANYLVLVGYIVFIVSLSGCFLTSDNYHPCMLAVAVAVAAHFMQIPNYLYSWQSMIATSPLPEH